MRAHVSGIVALGTVLLLPLLPPTVPKNRPSQVPTESAATPTARTNPQTDARVDVASAKVSHAYHEDPPTGPLPNTLEPDRFRDKKAAFVSYSLAAKIPKLLYQMPCYCPCDKNEGHESLLDCYVGDHGVGCPTCQKEVIYCYRQFQTGKTAAEIREGIEKGEAWKVDLKR
jgi:hypothetical protein